MLRKPDLIDERGGVLALSAILIPVFIVFVAMAVDVGTWFTHKRQLQNRADAAALSAGVEYGTRWAACGSPSTKAAAEAAIALAARQYGGDPQAAGTLRNTQVTEQTRVNVEINAPPALAGAVGQDTSWNDVGVVGGIGPCDPHPADAVSPNPNSIWTQVGVRERDQRSIFGMFGVDLLNNRAHARIELQPALAGKGFIPVAVPEQDIRQAELRYYRECGPGAPALLATVPLKQLQATPDNYQTVAGTTLWGPTIGNVAGGVPTGVTLSMPEATACAGSYIPVSAEVRIAGVEPTVLNINTATCAQLTASRFADCWSRVSNIRVFKDDPQTEPWFQEAEFNGAGSPACGAAAGPDAYFAASVNPTECRFTGWIAVEWNPSALGRDVDLSVNGVDLNPPNGPNGNADGVWTMPGTAINNIAGQSDVTIDWCVHIGPGNCRNGDPSASDIPIHSLFRNDDSIAQILDLVRTSGTAQAIGGPPGGALHWFRAQPTATSVTVYPTVGLESSLYIGQRRILRASGPQSNQSLDCEPATGGQGHDFQMFYTGCDPWYTDNKFAGAPWWFPSPPGPPPPPGSCPDKNGILAQPNGNDGQDAWECVVKAPGFTANVIGDGISAAIGNCADINNNQCQRHACTNPNYYDPADPDRWALMGGEASQRVVFLFIVPYGALKNTGPQEGLPILNFAAFYVTGWHGNNGNPGNNPCDSPDPDGAGPARPDEPADTGEIIGYFVDWTMPSAPGNPNAVCVVNQLRPCVPVLVR